MPVLHGIDFRLHEGEAVGIVGHNGVGKTTFLKALIGLVPARAGRISIDGIDVTRMKAHERSRLGVGYVPQGRGILPGLTALENLRLAWTRRFGRHRAGRDRAHPRHASRACASLLDRKGGALSGGEQQILALGRALMPSPWLLLLDEPSEGIQPSIVQEIGEILAALRQRDKLSLRRRRAEPRPRARRRRPHRRDGARPHRARARRARGAGRRPGRAARHGSAAHVPRLARADGTGAAGSAASRRGRRERAGPLRHRLACPGRGASGDAAGIGTEPRRGAGVEPAVDAAGPNRHPPTR